MSFLSQPEISKLQRMHELLHADYRGSKLSAAYFRIIYKRKRIWALVISVKAGIIMRPGQQYVWHAVINSPKAHEVCTPSRPQHRPVDIKWVPKVAAMSFTA